jgi:superfamily I DNA and/or RNA helicase
MQSQLFTRYSYDECTNEEKLFEKLDELLNEGKVEYNTENQYTFKIKDLELSDDEIQELCDLFEEVEVFPYMEEDSTDDDYDDDYNDFDDDGDDYNGRRYKSKDDDYEDF